MNEIAFAAKAACKSRCHRYVFIKHFAPHTRNQIDDLIVISVRDSLQRILNRFYDVVQIGDGVADMEVCKPKDHRGPYRQLNCSGLSSLSLYQLLPEPPIVGRPLR